MDALHPKPSAAQLRARFKKFAHRRLVVKATFDEMLVLYGDLDLSFEEIGRRLGIGTESARQYYLDYFEPILDETGRNRWRRRLKQRHADDLRSALEESRQTNVPLPSVVPPDETRREQDARVQHYSLAVLRLVADRAFKAGLQVQQVPRQNSRGTYRLRNWALLIERWNCQVHLITKARKQANGNSKRKYAGFCLNRCAATAYDAHIFVIQVPGRRTRVLVVPAYVLARVNGGKGSMIRGAIPIGSVGNRPAPPTKIDWWKYEDKWPLLSDSEEEEDESDIA